MKINRIAVIGIPLVIAAILIYYFRTIVGYVLIAWVISMLGDPLMDILLKKGRLNRFKFGNSLSAIIVLALFVIFIVSIFSVFVPLIVEQARNVSSVDFQAVGQALAEPINSINERLYSWGIINEVTSPTEQIQDLANKYLAPTLVGDIFGSVIGFAGNFVVTIFSVLFIAFFFLKERGLFGSFMNAVVPRGQEDRTSAAIDEIAQLLTRYFGGIVLQIIAISAFVSITLGVLGIKNALLIGFFAAIINVIPYVGPIIGATFGVMVTISANLDLDFYTQMLPLILQVIAVFACMQMLDNFLLQPFIFSNSVKAHPLEIFLIILVGGQLGGILGMVLAIPTYTVLRVIAKVFLSEFKVVQKITGGL